MLDSWTEISSGWIWLGVTLVASGLLIMSSIRKPHKEVRLNDTTTYVEQADGSRIVTQTTLAHPVHHSGVGESKVGGTTKSPADQVRERMEQAARQLRGDEG